MALIIEDGTIVENANSFASVADCRAFADARGLDLPTADEDVETLLIKATDFIFSLEGDFQGNREHVDQELPFPRDGILLFGADVSGTIPKVLKQAQCRLAFDASQADLLATGGGRVVRREGVGPLQVEYETNGPHGDSNPQVQLTAALTILDPLFNSSSTANGGGINICVGK